jgi:predicted dehydrogenase
METEDYAAALGHLPNGAPVSITATTAAYPGGPERIEIIGTGGTARIVGGTLNVDFLDGRREEVIEQGTTGAGASFMDFPNDAHRAAIVDFLDAIETGRDPLVTGEEAMATQVLIDDILSHRR